jgi:hypothetical protein
MTGGHSAQHTQGHVLLTASWEAIALLGALTLMAWLTQGAAFIVCVLVLSGWCFALLVKGTSIANSLGGKRMVKISRADSASASLGAARGGGGDLCDGNDEVVHVRRRRLAGESEEASIGGRE